MSFFSIFLHVSSHFGIMSVSKNSKKKNIVKKKKERKMFFFLFLLMLIWILRATYVQYIFSIWQIEWNKYFVKLSLRWCIFKLMTWKYVSSLDAVMMVPQKSWPFFFTDFDGKMLIKFSDSGGKSHMWGLFFWFYFCLTHLKCCFFYTQPIFCAISVLLRVCFVIFLLFFIAFSLSGSSAVP